MSIIESLFADSLNGFSIKYLPFFLFQLFSAGLFAYVFQFVINKKAKEKLLENSVLIAVAVTLITSLVKYSLPFSVLGAALLLVAFKTKTESKKELISKVLILLIGLGCGVGSIVQTAIGLAVLGVIIVFTPMKD
jgi:hypothetical protein